MKFDPSTAVLFEEAPAGKPSGFDPSSAVLFEDEEKSKGRSLKQVAGDVGVSLLKGAIGLPEAFVGLADIPTGGRVGKALESVGYRPADAKNIVDDWYSDPQKEANANVQKAEGFGDTLMASVENPSTVAMTALESLPSMLGGAGMARGLLKAAPKVAPVIAGAFGEGAVGAGSAASQSRSESKDGLLSSKQAVSAVGSGIGTGLIGFAGGKLAQKLGIADVDTLLASGEAQKVTKGFARQVIGAGISEGAFEEMPQSAQEQMWSNYAEGKNITDGIGNASARGLLAGASMGMVGGAANTSIGKRPVDGVEQSQAEEVAADSFPDVQEAVSAADLYGMAPEQSQAAPAVRPMAETPADVGTQEIDTPPAPGDGMAAQDSAPMAAPAEMDPEAAAVETTLQRAYGDNPVLVDLITSQGGGLGLGGMAETLARVAPKVAAAKDLIESARAARQNAEIAAEQEAIITAEVAQAAAQPPAVEPPAATEQPAPLIQAQQSRTTPIQRRDDLIGAIMRVTGGYGIHPDMAMTLTGDTANRVPKLRGLFTANGQQDMDDLAGMLRESEGYDVADGEALAGMIREAAAGNYAKSMERTAQDANDAAEKQQRDNIRKLAKKFNVKTVGVKYSTVEKIVFETMEARHKAAVQSLDERARARYDAMLKDALEIVDYDEIDAILTDAHNRFSGRDFYLAATRQMRGYIEDVTTERQAKNAGQDSEADTETGEPDWLRDGPEGSGSGSDPVAAPEAARSEPAQEEVAPALILEGQTNAQAAADYAQEQKRIADEAKANAEADRMEREAALKKEVKARADAAASTFQLGQSGLDNLTGQASIFDAPTANQNTIKKTAEQPAADTPAKAVPGADNKIFTADRAAKARELLRKKLGQLNAGIDPEIIQAGIELAGYHVEAGARTFAAYSKAMIADIGDVVKPYLKSWYLAVRNYPGFDNAGMESEADLVKAAASIDAAAHEAATSPKNDLPEPTQAQKEAGNYAKGHIRVSGLDISIENPEGSTRSGVDPNGKAWSTEMKSHYGYLLGTIGKDKDHVDVFVKPGTAEDYAGPVFVIDQKKTNGHFDEHKSMIGWATQDAAVLAYKSNYAKGWDGIAAVSPMSMEVFKDWVLSADKTAKAADWLKIKTSAPAASKEVPLNEIIVRVSAIVEETGEEITLSEKADEALSDVDKRLELARDLLKCLAS